MGVTGSSGILKLDLTVSMGSAKFHGRSKSRESVTELNGLEMASKTSFALSAGGISRGRFWEGYPGIMVVRLSD